MNTYFRMDKYDRVYRVVEEKIDLSDEAFRLFNYIRHKGATYVVTIDENGLEHPEAILDELTKAGLIRLDEEVFFLPGEPNGYRSYTITYVSED
jgi:hypothetical protein